MASAPEATAGGSAVVQIKPEAKLRMKSQIVTDAVTYVFLEILFNVNDITGQGSVDGVRRTDPPESMVSTTPWFDGFTFRACRIFTTASDRVCSNGGRKCP
jgi:hypothetical protein